MPVCCLHRTKPEGAKVMPNDIVVFKSLLFSTNGLHVSVAEVRDLVMQPVDKHPSIMVTREVR